MQIEQTCRSKNTSIIEFFSSNGKESIMLGEKKYCTFFRRLWIALKQFFKLNNQAKPKLGKKEYKQVYQTELAEIPTVLHIEISAEKINLLL